MDLYVAATGGIYLFLAAGQASGASGIQIISDDLIVDVVSLGANLAGNQLSIWGRTDAGVVFYSRCALGSQSDPTAWSAPIPLLTGVDQLATMLDLTTRASVLYSHTGGQQVVKLQQNPVTTQWRQSLILLPALSIDDVLEFYTYTTRIEALDENQLPANRPAVFDHRDQPVRRLYRRCVHAAPYCAVVAGVALHKPGRPLTLKCRSSRGQRRHRHDR
jgi:hypothetical protein